MGLLTLTSDGRMMSVLVDGQASLPEGTARQYSSYWGNYTFDGSTLTTIVDANCDPVCFSAPQVRKVRFESEAHGPATSAGGGERHQSDT